MNAKSDDDQLISLFPRIMHKFSLLEKTPRDYGVDCTLYTSEIHTIDLIGKNPGIKVTELAKKLGITKGAVPKIIRKLEQKDLISRYQVDKNKKEILLKLTAKGEIAYCGHKKYHKIIDKIMMKKFNLLKSEQKKFLYRVFNELEKSLNKLLQK